MPRVLSSPREPWAQILPGMRSRVRSEWEAMREHGLGVRLTTSQLFDPSHFTSPNQVFTSVKWE